MINNKELNSPNEFFKMGHKRKESLLDWIAFNLIERKTFNIRYSSYRLKHLVPFYITNGEFKGAMLHLGYIPQDKNFINWNFNTNLRKEGIKCKR